MISAYHCAKLLGSAEQTISTVTCCVSVPGRSLVPEKYEQGSYRHFDHDLLKAAELLHGRHDIVMLFVNLCAVLVPSCLDNHPYTLKGRTSTRVCPRNSSQNTICEQFLSECMRTIIRYHLDVRLQSVSYLCIFEPQWRCLCSTAAKAHML